MGRQQASRLCTPTSAPQHILIVWGIDINDWSHDRDVITAHGNLCNEATNVSGGGHIMHWTTFAAAVLLLAWLAGHERSLRWCVGDSEEVQAETEGNAAWLAVTLPSSEAVDHMCSQLAKCAF
jgi:hypothetical protein